MWRILHTQKSKIGNAKLNYIEEEESFVLRGHPLRSGGVPQAGSEKVHARHMSRDRRREKKKREEEKWKGEERGKRA